MDRPPPSGRWTTPSELGEYTFCPRSWWYTHREDRGRRTLEPPVDPSFERGLQVGLRPNFDARGLSLTRDL